LNGENHPRLVITIGLPKSGKSTHLDNIGPFGWTILCPDDFRWAIYGQEFFKQGEPFVWAAVEAAARAILRRNGHVIIDATNMTLAARSTWRRLAREFDIQLEALVWDIPYDLCQMRAREEGAYHMEEVILRMFKQWEAIQDWEKIKVVHTFDS
jgi:predicted kinase